MKLARGERRMRRRRMWLTLGGVMLCLGGALLAVALTHGVDGLRWFFGARWLEARSGRKYTPTGAVKRYVEKLGEEELKK